MGGRDAVKYWDLDGRHKLLRPANKKQHFAFDDQCLIMVLLVQGGKLPIDGAIVMVIGMLMDPAFGGSDGDGCHPFGAALSQWC